MLRHSLNFLNYANGNLAADKFVSAVADFQLNLNSRGQLRADQQLRLTIIRLYIANNIDSFTFELNDAGHFNHAISTNVFFLSVCKLVKYGNVMDAILNAVHIPSNKRAQFRCELMLILDHACRCDRIISNVSVLFKSSDYQLSDKCYYRGEFATFMEHIFNVDAGRFSVWHDCSPHLLRILTSDTDINAKNDQGQTVLQLYLGMLIRKESAKQLESQKSYAMKILNAISLHPSITLNTLNDVLPLIQPLQKSTSKNLLEIAKVVNGAIESKYSQMVPAIIQAIQVERRNRFSFFNAFPDDLVGMTENFLRGKMLHKHN